MNGDQITTNHGRKNLFAPKSILDGNRHSHINVTSGNQTFIGFNDLNDEYWQSAPEEAILIPSNHGQILEHTQLHHNYDTYSEIEKIYLEERPIEIHNEV
jgi:hypothetical protein